MIFGLKRKRSIEEEPTDAEARAIVAEETDESEEFGEPDEGRADIVEATLEEAMDDVGPYSVAMTEDAGADRSDGPFDIDEVDLIEDTTPRKDFGALIITPWDGLQLQATMNPATRKLRTITAIWQGTGLEVALFAAPATGGLAQELREDIVEEAEQAGGSTTLSEGPFGTEVRRVLPVEGPKGEQLFHVSRVWFAEGPRWLLRGTLLGQASLGDAADPKARPFLEFFRNLVVRRGEKPMVPGELIELNAESEG